MRQALTIFRKDLKHLWPLAAGMVAILALHGWVDFRMHSGYLKVMNTRFFSLEPVFALFAWWCLAGVVVQQESLPGDRQYWLTRPINRKAILAAKALFLVAFVSLPNFLAQTVVLAAAGFPPANYLGALLYNQAFICGYLVLAAAVAAVTRRFREYLAASVALGVVVVVFMNGLTSRGDWGQGGVEWVRDTAFHLDWLLGGFAVLALQYLCAAPCRRDWCWVRA